MNVKEFKEIWDICPTGKGGFWRKHHNRYLSKTLEKWFDEHLVQLINLILNKCATKIEEETYTENREEDNLVEHIVNEIRKFVVTQ